MMHTPGTDANAYIAGRLYTISASAISGIKRTFTLVTAPAVPADWNTGDSYSLLPGSGFIGLPVTVDTATGKFVDIGDTTFTTTAPLRIVGTGNLNGESWFEVVLNRTRDSQSA